MNAENFLNAPTGKDPKVAHRYRSRSDTKVSSQDTNFASFKLRFTLDWFKDPTAQFASDAYPGTSTLEPGYLAQHPVPLYPAPGYEHNRNLYETSKLSNFLTLIIMASGFILEIKKKHSIKFIESFIF